MTAGCPGPHGVRGRFLVRGCRRGFEFVCVVVMVMVRCLHRGVMGAGPDTPPASARPARRMVRLLEFPRDHERRAFRWSNGARRRRLEGRATERVDDSARSAGDPATPVSRDRRGPSIRLVSGAGPPHPPPDGPAPSAARPDIPAPETAARRVDDGGPSRRLHRADGSATLDAALPLPQPTGLPHIEFRVGRAVISTTGRPGPLDGAVVLPRSAGSAARRAVGWSSGRTVTSTT